MTKKDRARAEALANALDVAFSWSETKEGGEYWLAVSEALWRIGAEGK